jgi:exopolysaccharide production protein ExoZ
MTPDPPVVVSATVRDDAPALFDGRYRRELVHFRTDLPATTSDDIVVYPVAPGATQLAALLAKHLMIFSVQYLRFIAAFMVVLSHSLFSLSSHWPDQWPDDPSHQFVMGAAGVDIFFVISGFIMVFITDRKERTALDFVWHRLARVVPPYWAVTIFLGLTILSVPGAFQTRLELAHFTASLLFLPYPHPTVNETLPLYIPGWTLNYEFFFYTLFAIALAINAKARALLTSFALVTLVAAGQIWPLDNFVYAFYTSPVLIEFIYGMIIGQLVVIGATAQRGTSVALIFLGIAAFLIVAQAWPMSRLSGARPIVWGLPAALLVAGAVFWETDKSARPIKVFVVLGDASYAIYITHAIVLGPLFKVLERAGMTRSLSLAFAGAAIAVGAGVAFHFMIERPLLVFFRPRLNPRMS